MSTIGGANYKAGGTISKYRVLELDASNPEDELTACDADTDIPIAVSTNAATTSQPGALTYVLLRPGEKFSITASAAITALDKLAPTTGGKVKTGAHGDYLFAIADEDATTDGDVIQATAINGYFYAVDN